MAKRLIERITRYTEYNVNIMDEKGIIIASKNVSRIGTFHEVALQIIKGDQDIIRVENENTQFGVKKGVNMAIYYKKRKEGVVGVTGDPEEVMPIALIIRMAVEVMLEYELFKYEKMQRRNLKEQLLNIILYKDDLQKADWERLNQQIHMREDLIRVPILINVEGDIYFCEHVLNIFRSGSRHSSQDLICLTRDGDILIYKAMECELVELMRNYKYIVAESLSDGLRYMRSAGYSYSVFVGSFQNNFQYYRLGYEHCVWLKQNTVRGESSYFYDDSSRYFMSTLPLTELQVAYYAIEKNLGEKFLESFKEIVEALKKANFNLGDASKLMHVHKNTLVYRLDKIRDTLNVDPIGNSNDREFVNNFYHYLKRKEKLYQM